MPDLIFVAQFPIEDESAPVEQLRAEAVEQARPMITGLGFTPAGAWVFELLDLPLAMHLQATVPVKPFQFPGVK